MSAAIPGGLLLTEEPMYKHFLFCLPAILFAASTVDTSEPKLAKSVDLTTYSKITYHAIADDPDLARHQLDVYRPKGKDGLPVLFFLHGGGWVAGSKDDVFGVFGYGTIARNLAQRGMVVVIPNYRLSPGVRHPEHIKDVARAFRWTCENIEKYGGDPRQIFVAGHSAGGHLAALLVTDQTYLKSIARAPRDIRGVIAISGVYRLDDVELKLAVADPNGTMRFSLNVNPAASVFGADAKVLRDASPLTHVRSGLPPFLIMSAGYDYPPLSRMAKEFTAALEKYGCKVEMKVIPERTHETMLFDIPHFSVERLAADAIVEFIERYSPAKGKGKKL
jgi:acetyl esterase/lipase